MAKEAEQWVLWRGSAGFLLTPYGYLGLFHIVRQYNLGRVYSQKWVLLSKHFPYLPLWASAPFRMPAPPHAMSDIQFPMGLIAGANGTALVSYGVQDCSSMLAEVALPDKDQLRRADQAQNPRDMQVRAF